ncbi:N-acetyltransferase GCN5 [Actinoplanes friuliensis DSM 7358]|uniref:N-acetyltransferase GCN5 n=1 Tax=Actinoplanes friuliensis DSM 7358 TaxID=1246995 RepID=U5WBB0_9ACTN|nr:N-acetyltransferase GCN5 [Actinoplanes friuliensis DSM 7358]
MEPLTDNVKAFEIATAAFEVDAPGFPLDRREAFVARMQNPWPGNTLEHHAALLDGVTVGYVKIAMSQLDNLTSVDVEITVHPAYRRRGAGRALRDFAVARAREEGRKHLVAPASDGQPSGAAFATTVGAKAGLAEVRSRLDVAEVTGEPGPIAAGYRLVQWVNVAPEEFLDDIGYLDGRINEDAPNGDLVREAEKIDAARVRASEKAVRTRGRSAFNTGAVHEGSGRLVAWTMIASPDDAHEQAWQNATVVGPEHRGHGLGLTIKQENLRLARTERPALRVVDTFNAAENEHMIRINRQLGFRRMEAWTQWQLTL